MKIIHSSDTRRGVGYLVDRNLVRFVFDSEAEFLEFQKQIPAKIYACVSPPMSPVAQLFAHKTLTEDDLKWQIDITYHSDWRNSYTDEKLSEKQIAEARIKGEVAKNKKTEKFLFQHGVIEL